MLSELFAFVACTCKNQLYIIPSNKIDKTKEFYNEAESAFGRGYLYYDVDGLR